MYVSVYYSIYYYLIYTNPSSTYPNYPLLGFAFDRDEIEQVASSRTFNSKRDSVQKKAKRQLLNKEIDKVKKALSKPNNSSLYQSKLFSQLGDLSMERDQIWHSDWDDEDDPTTYECWTYN